MEPRILYTDGMSTPCQVTTVTDWAPLVDTTRL